MASIIFSPDTCVGLDTAGFGQAEIYRIQIHTINLKRFPLVSSFI